jgi:hypothetical protein
LRDNLFKNLHDHFEADHEEFANSTRRLGWHAEPLSYKVAIRAISQVRPGLVNSTRRPDLTPLDVPAVTFRPGVLNVTRQPNFTPLDVPASTSRPGMVD